ncbi:MAG: cysteine desulfurase [Oscillospiraceae bacterium]|nr:cysteine desulfurase [Oscillospiraceae bacterium]
MISNNSDFEIFKNLLFASFRSDDLKIYLDNSATSYPKPECVYDAVNVYMRENGASPGRGNYANAMASDKLVYETRKTIAKLLGAKKPSEIVFTSNATEAINIVLKGYLKNGDGVLTSNIEHNAMWRPLKNLENNRGVQISYFSVAKDGKVDLDEIADKLTENIKLVAFVHGSNVLGNIIPVAEISKLAHSKNIPVLIDASQTAGAYPINVIEDGIDFLAFTGHKSLLGPTGTGGFYIRSGLQLDTLKEGGTGSMAKSPFQPELPPDRFEAGTMNIFGIAGLKAAVDYIQDIGVSNILSHERWLLDRLLCGLKEIPDIEIYGSMNPDEKLGLVSFNIGNNDPYKIASKLDEEHGIMVRAGLHCAPQAHKIIGTDEKGAVRASVGFFNTEEHIDLLLETLQNNKNK